MTEKELTTEKLLQQELKDARKFHRKNYPTDREGPPEMAGQIWDECSRCGREPIYLPLELCESCWPPA